MTNSATPLIELKGVCHYFVSGQETVKALKNVTLAIQPGEMVAIVGTSGSGKSTLMNLIGCLDIPTEGDVKIKGILTRQASHEQQAELRSHYIGFIFQRYHLMPYLSAMENVAVPALYTSLPHSERRRRAESLLTSLGLQQRMESKPVQLSGGQQQRVSIARALMNGAEIILADEPTGALDRSSGQSLMEVLHTLHRVGHTIVIVTHDRDIARQAQRIIEISDGEIIADELNAFAAQHDTAPKFPVIRVARRPLFWRNVQEMIRMAWRALMGHRIRAFLSMLGIIIGIASVMLSMAAGEGARQQIIDEISQLGTSTLEIFPGLGWNNPRPDFVNALKLADVSRLAGQLYVDSVSPTFNHMVTAIHGGKLAKVSLYGISSSYFYVQGLHFLAGQGFTEDNLTHREPMVIIDSELSATLFRPQENPLGRIVQLNGVPFRITGVAERPGGKYSGMMLEAWIPYTSMLERMSGPLPLESISLRVNQNVSLPDAENRITSLLEQAHKRHDFFIQSNEQIIRTIGKASDSMSLLITAIACISLLVGGVGVMNIMLVSVTERTHEIGIRLSVGARPQDIMIQFLIEAIVICLLGGVTGIVVAGVVGMVFSWLTPTFTLIFTWPPVVLSCAFSALTGLAFGIFPARSAARLQPTEALARE